MDRKEQQAHIRCVKKLVRQELENLGFSKMRTPAGPADFLFVKHLENDFALILQPDIRNRDGTVRMSPNIELEYAPLERKISNDKLKIVRGICHIYIGYLPSLTATVYDGGDWYFEYSEPVSSLVDKFIYLIVEHAMPVMMRFANADAAIELLETRANREKEPSGVAVSSAPQKLKLMRELQNSR